MHLHASDQITAELNASNECANNRTSADIVPKHDAFYGL